MSELFCWRCDSRDLSRYTRSRVSYRCNNCREDFTSSGIKDFLLEKVSRETEKLGQPGACPRCGRPLGDPKWCSWCGMEPYSPAAEIRRLNDQIRSIEGIIAADLAEDREIAAGIEAEDGRARQGDEQALSRIFTDAGYADGKTRAWERLVNVGPAAVPFLLGKLAGDHREKKAAVNALIDLGDERAVVPLIGAINPLMNQGNDREILEALDTRWIAIAARHVALLLDKINEILAAIKPEDDYSRQIIEKILKLLETILERSAGEVPEPDLRALSGVKDISLVVAVADLSKTIHGDDGWGYLDYHPTNDVTQVSDCSALREAAGRELMRRGLK